MYITSNTQTLVLNVYRLDSTNSSIASSGSGTINIGMEYINTTVLPVDELNDGDVTLTIYTDYPNVWDDYLTNMILGTGVTISPPDSSFNDGLKVTMYHVSKLIISEHWAKITFSGLYA